MITYKKVIYNGKVSEKELLLINDCTCRLALLDAGAYFINRVVDTFNLSWSMN